jgi:hypothetical protein
MSALPPAGTVSDVILLPGFGIECLIITMMYMY